MKVVILSTSVYGTTGHHLRLLHGNPNLEIKMVVISSGVVASKKKNYRKRINKILRIGVLGAMNGIRMRKWYNEGVAQYCTIDNAEEYCAKHNIPFRRVPSTNSAETVNAFKESGAEIGLSLGNGYISSKVFDIPKHGMLNVHHELLPKYQNAQSIIWEIYNGSSNTGYTIHKIDKHIDTGAILYQETIPITFRDTLADTVSYNYAKLFDASAAGFNRVFDDFDAYYKNARPQGKGTSYTTPTFSQFLKINRQYKRLKNAALKK